jgi:hypothetical protein
VSPELPLEHLVQPPDPGRCLEDLDGAQCDQNATPHDWHRALVNRRLVVWRMVADRLIVWRAR